MDDPKQPNPTPDPTPADPKQPGGPVNQNVNYDKLASDRIGEELNPNATIWKLYTEEAKEYDTEFTRERNENLNNMLLFATLFSAIVTAFIIESTNLLEQDSSDVSAQLLLMLVQSQQRIETGSPNTTSSPIEMPDFVASPTARVINVLWFASLMISLGAAVVAILAKEWLTAFTTNRTRDARKYALERQARHAALDAWKMLLVIDLLPTFLNFALFVFGLGLVIRLWLLDLVVAGAMTAVSAVLCVIYVFFVIAGAAYENCPYKSRLSAYIKESVTYAWEIMRSSSIFRDLTSNRSISSNTPGDTKQSNEKCLESKEVGLLIWLYSFSSDPILETYVTQALAGLMSLKLKLPTFLDKGTTGFHELYITDSERLTSVFELGAQAVDQLQMAPSRGRNELDSCGGINVARLAVAVAEIYPHALTWQMCSPQEVIHARGDTTEELAQNHSPRPATQGCIPTIDMKRVCKITDNIYGALDLVWAETSPALRLIAYAYLLAAELKMVRHSLAFQEYQTQQPLASLGHAAIEMDAHSGAQPQSSSSNLHGILERGYQALVQITRMIKSSAFNPFRNGSKQPNPCEGNDGALPGDSPIGTADMAGRHPILPDIDQDSLRKRYSLALARTALVIKASVSHLTSKGSQDLRSAIITLLAEATELVKQEKSRPNDESHRYGTENYWDSREIAITIAAESRTTHRVTCKRYAVGYVLMESLVKLCDSDMDTLLVEDFRVAAFNLLLTFWPTYFQQQRQDQASEFILHPWMSRSWETITLGSTPCDSQMSAEILMYQSTVLIHIAVALGTYNNLYSRVLLPWETEGWKNVLQHVLQLLIARYRALPKITRKLRNQADNQRNLYSNSLPTGATLGDWMTLIDQYLVSTDQADAELETVRRLRECFGLYVAEIARLPAWPMEDQSDDGVRTGWIDAHSPAVSANATAESPLPRIDQVMYFICAGSQATDRDDDASVIWDFLYRLSEHIKSTSCRECLSYFTQENGLEVLAKIALSESDRHVVLRVASIVVMNLPIAQLPANATALPSLLKVLCYICDSDYNYRYDIDAFLLGARFQLEQLSTAIGPSSYFPVQKLIHQLTRWANAWESQGRSSIAQNITAFRDQVQQWADPTNSGHVFPPLINERGPGPSATSNTIPSAHRSPEDSAPEDTPTEASLGDRGDQTEPTGGAVPPEPIAESAGILPDEEQSAEESEEEGADQE
ncbi:unnamed protein product [Rhizoctonia solani]|uniref:DUF6535 domain-containing protein n=1 Tax=Rhizoctonia solani TaxID=456999 RepID=A0A8H3HHP5_9AGAM|nr:unnamed protein product [Rhizoctonia solani]